MNDLPGVFEHYQWQLDQFNSLWTFFLIVTFGMAGFMFGTDKELHRYARRFLAVGYLIFALGNFWFVSDRMDTVITTSQVLHYLAVHDVSPNNPIVMLNAKTKDTEGAPLVQKYRESIRPWPKWIPWFLLPLHLLVTLGMGAIILNQHKLKATQAPR